MIFTDFGFEERIQRGIDEAGFTVPTPVQEQCFKLLITEHRDIYAQSQTGTGKTAAFLLGIFQLLVEEEKHKDDKALIIVPTRELAVQIEQEASLLGKYLDLTITSVFGGMGYGVQERKLTNGVDILVGTPGRLIDFQKKGTINFSTFGFFVIDEADRLFDMGFLPDIRKIFKWMKPKEERITLLFSATLNTRVGNLAWEFMNNPGEIIIEPEKVTVDTVTQELYHVGKEEKIQLLLGLLKKENPENAVIFTNTQHVAWEVAKRMEVNGYNVHYLIGDLPQNKRLKIVNDVKKGHHKFLVATDVASRGLHIDELEMVINYDVPLEPEAYVHRVGRTARIGNKGKTITMACEEYVYGLAPIEKLLGKKIPVVWADENLLQPDKSFGIKFTSSDRYRELGKRDRDSMDNDKKFNKRSSKFDQNNKRKNTDKDKSDKTSDGKISLDQKAIRVQSAVSLAAGAAGSLPGSTDAIKSGNKNRNHKSGKAKQIRDRHKSRNKSPDKSQKVNFENTDEKMEYYRRKYGEDFSSVKAGGSKSGKNQNKPYKKINSSTIDSVKPSATRSPASSSGVPAASIETKPEKVGGKNGLFSRLFGK